jgi:hypothetical protein
MSDESVQVTVQAQSNVLGLTAGQIATVEVTPLVQTHIDAAHLAVVEAAQGDADSDGTPDPTNDPADPSNDGSGEGSDPQ